jgi:hypothetical protein
MAATLGGAAPAPAKRALRPSKAVATVVGAAMRDADARDQAHRARSAAAAAAAGGQGAFGGGFGTKDVSDIEAFEGALGVANAVTGGNEHVGCNACACMRCVRAERVGAASALVHIVPPRRPPPGTRQPPPLSDPHCFLAAS